MSDFPVTKELVASLRRPTQSPGRPPWRRPLVVAAAFLAASELDGRAAEAVPLGPAEAEQLEPCAQLLFESRGGGDREKLMSCRLPLLGSLHEDQIPGYRYNATEDCHFWAQFAARDRTIEGSRVLDFNRLAAYRLDEPFSPPLRPNGTALYIGAHRLGEDGLEFQQRHGLHMHLFEPSPTFFRSLQETLGASSGFTLHNYGLGARTRRAWLRLSGTASRAVDGVDLEENEADVSSAPASDASSEQVLIRSTAEAVPEVLASSGEGEPAGSVELLHVNCEGCEYDVVEGLRQAGQLAAVEQVQLATHLLDSSEPAADFQEAVALSLQVSISRYCEMHRTLSETHDRVWGLPWVWERWTRRRDPEERNTQS